MQPRRLRSAYVATLSTAALAAAGLGGLACNPPRPLPPNPPSPQPEQTAPEGSASAQPDGSGAQDQGGAAAGTQLAGSGELNPRDAADRTIMLNYNDDGCFVYLPFPPLKEGEMRVPGTAPPTQPVQCPPIMSDPAFAQCRGGTLTRKGDGCECFLPGNPPRVKMSDCPG